MPPLQLTISAVRVGHQLEMAQDPPQPRRVQPTRRLHQHRLGLHSRPASGSSWVPWASTAAWATRDLPTDQGAGRGGQRTPEHGPGRPDTAGRSPSTQRNRVRNQPAVEPTSWPWSAPAAPRPSTTASCRSQWPSSRSTSRRNAKTCSAKAASVSPSRSWAANPSTATARDARWSGRPAPSRVDWLIECVFESMAATYQARHREHKHQPTNLGTTSPDRATGAGRRLPARSWVSLVPR